MSSALETFHVKHGAEWSSTVQSPAFLAAFTLSNLEKIQSIAVLTDDEIAKHGSIILSDLRGHFRYENALIGLHQKKQFVFQDIGPETYPDPATEAYDAEVAAKEASRQERDESIAPVFQARPEEKKLPLGRQRRKLRQRKKRKKRGKQ